jgi:hypothetical protein
MGSVLKVLTRDVKAAKVYIIFFDNLIIDLRRDILFIIDLIIDLGHFENT